MDVTLTGTSWGYYKEKCMQKKKNTLKAVI